MKYTAGIIGTGRIAGLFDSPNHRENSFNHARVYLKIKNMDLIAACDKNEKRLEKFCKVWNIREKYSDVEDLLEKKKLDIISLCTPNDTHFLLMKTILKHDNRPRVLFVEKPICITREELTGIKKLLSKVNTKLIVNHIYRFNPALLKVRSILKGGELGNIVLIRAVYYGGLLNNGVHVVDTLRMLANSEFKIITAKIGAENNPEDPCIDAELSSAVLPKAKIFLESFNENYYQLYEMEIRLEKGRIRIMDFWRDVFIDKVVMNNSGEKELKTFKKITASQNKSPLINISKNIEAYFSIGNETIFSEAGIEQVEKTMAILWKLRERATN